MAEIYTISGSEMDTIDGFGDFGATADAEKACAQQVKVPFFAGTAAQLTAVPVGLFGTYKMLKKQPAAGIVAVLGAAILWFAGNRVMASSVRQFDACRRAA
jgi:hypothetical protein